MICEISKFKESSRWIKKIISSMWNEQWNKVFSCSCIKFYINPFIQFTNLLIQSQICICSYWYSSQRGATSSLKKYKILQALFAFIKFAQLCTYLYIYYLFYILQALIALINCAQLCTYFYTYYLFYIFL